MTDTITAAYNRLVFAADELVAECARNDFAFQLDALKAALAERDALIEQLQREVEASRETAPPMVLSAAVGEGPWVVRMAPGIYLAKALGRTRNTGSAYLFDDINDAIAIAAHAHAHVVSLAEAVRNG